VRDSEYFVDLFFVEFSGDAQRFTVQWKFVKLLY